MKGKATIGVMFFVLCCSVAFASIDDCIDATCRITAGDGGRGTGCAFERSQGYVYVLTCAHVATGDTVQCEFWRAGHQSTPLPGRVVQRVPAVDAAIVAVREDAFGGVLPATIPMADRSRVMQTGETVTSVGCAQGAWSTGWKGHVLGYGRDDGSLRFTPVPANGRSGSAVFDVEGTMIVGLLRARTVDDAQGIATSIQQLHAGLGSVSSAQSAAQCPGGLCPIPGRLFGGGQQQPQPQQQSPWPTLPPIQQAVPSIDLTPIVAGLDRLSAGQDKIAELLADVRGRMEATAEPDAAPPVPPPPSEVIDQAARDGVVKLTEAVGANRQAIESLGGSIGGVAAAVEATGDEVKNLSQSNLSLFERFQERLDRVKEAAGDDAGKGEIIRGYIKDFAAEKLEGSAIGGLLGKLGFAGGGIGIGLLIMAFVVIRRDIKDRVATGDPLIIEKAFGGVRSLVGGLHGKIDDLKGRIRGDETEQS
ncbi:MAG TPA: serine protease [Thermoguttaceae bacterium]|nr:serine protease [Thermoguttaceae bacterium]